MRSNDLFLSLLTPLGRFGVAFWRLLGFEAVPKSNIVAYNQHKIITKGVEEGVLNKNMFWGWVWDAKIGGLKK